MHRFGAGLRCAGWSQSSPTEAVSLDRPNYRQPTSSGGRHRLWPVKARLLKHPGQSICCISQSLCRRQRCHTSASLSSLGWGWNKMRAIQKDTQTLCPYGGVGKCVPLLKRPGQSVFHISHSVCHVSKNVCNKLIYVNKTIIFGRGYLTSGWLYERGRQASFLPVTRWITTVNPAIWPVAGCMREDNPAIWPVRGQLAAIRTCTVGRHLYVASWPPPARVQLAATCTWPVGRHLHVSSWPPPARVQLAATCTCTVGRHLYVASWPPSARVQLAATCTCTVGRHLYVAS